MNYLAYSFYDTVINHSFKYFKAGLSVLFVIFLLNVKANAQSDTIEVIPIIIEFGMGFPISLNDHKQYFDSYINLGYQKQIYHYFTGFLLGGHYRQRFSSDFGLSSKLRIGKMISANYTISFDSGVSLYSQEHLSIPGITLGLNFAKTNKYGIHMRYDVYNSPITKRESNIVLGLHLSGKGASKIGLPFVGGVGLLTAFFISIISKSR